MNVTRAPLTSLFLAAVEKATRLPASAGPSNPCPSVQPLAMASSSAATAQKIIPAKTSIVDPNHYVTLPFIDPVKVERQLKIYRDQEARDPEGTARRHQEIEEMINRPMDVMKENLKRKGHAFRLENYCNSEPNNATRNTTSPNTIREPWHKSKSL